ncbi:MAG TPA: SDR family oxidoreductase [Anaerolineaceae bacterium]|nr:SDR family oxidoreductase [Anaerolineaceae bacterium]
MDLNLKGKIALVTGASRGLGFATANVLSEEGCQVVINGRNDKRIQQAAQSIYHTTGNPVLGIEGDVSRLDDVERVVSSTVDHFGGLDILVTNAGGPPPGGFEKFDDEAWLNAFNLTFMSHVRLIRAALPHLRKSAAASVLTITSYSIKQPINGLILSNSIRTSVAGLTKSLALDWGKEGIRFNSILPGWTETERVTQLMQASAEQNNTSIDEEIAKQIAESPLGRMAKPEEFARAAAFIVSPAASYITGILLPLDGGMIKGTF